MLTLREFLAATKNMSPDTVIVAPTREHCYRGTKVEVTTGKLYTDGTIDEDWNQAGIKIPIIVVR